MEQGFMEEKALELGLCRMNRNAQKQIHISGISRGLATSVKAHAGSGPPHLLPPCVPGPAPPL